MMLRLTLEPRGAGWVAYPDGKSAPVLRPVPGNAYPAHAAWWATKSEARAELARWFGADTIVAEEGR